MRIDDGLIDDTLRNTSSWQPSAGFAERVASRAFRVPQKQLVAPQFWSFANVAAVVPLAVLTAAGSYVIGGLVDALTRATVIGSATSIETTWVWVFVSYAIAAWFVSRPQPVE
jgi:hypothetical protein